MKNRTGQFLGFTPFFSNGSFTNALNAPGTWYGLSFVADGQTLSAVRTYVSAVTGSLAAADISASLYDSAGVNGAPGTAIESGKLPTATITASGLYDFAGFTTALTAGQQYWIVFKNGSGSPASNYCTFLTANASLLPTLGAASFTGFWGVGSSTNSGSTWSCSAHTNLRVAYANGSFDGIVFTGTPFRSNDLVYGSRESGVVLKTPDNASLNVCGIAMQIVQGAGTPTGKVRFGLWEGATPANAGYTNANPAVMDGAQPGWAFAYFPSTITVPSGTVLRVTLAETSNADGSANAYRLDEIPTDPDSNSLALLPFGGSLRKTYFDGTAWTDDSPSGGIFGFALLLNTAGEFGGV